MLWAILGILIGIIIGLISNYSIPLEYIKYTAVIIVGILNSLFGAIKAETSKTTKKNSYSAIIFLTGLLTNIILALGITLLGEQLGLDLYLAVTVVFIFKIFNNIGIIRRSILKKFLGNKYVA